MFRNGIFLALKKGAQSVKINRFKPNSECSRMGRFFGDNPFDPSDLSNLLNPLSPHFMFGEDAQKRRKAEEEEEEIKKRKKAEEEEENIKKQRRAEEESTISRKLK